jgi:hypothetical protein
VIQLKDTTRVIPFYRPEPLTNLPLLYNPEHLFPYTSYGETAPTPVPRAFRMVVLENEFLRVEVAPELGGRVYSLHDKRIGKDVLFSNPVVKPVRILPVWGFISGGIEFNFPIAHSPTSIDTVGCATGQSGEYGFIRVGEREARTGMEWVVELGLVSGSPVLVQRTALRNRTGQAHPWMMWTICAVRSTVDTEFVHPPHRVLVHDHRVIESEWPGDGLNWNRNFREMTALFWKPGSAPAFGAFHHDLGFGLMHLAEPAQLPGKKIWTYGFGRHRSWGVASTEGDLCYVEIESGPLLDQSEKPLFPSGREQRYEEFWVPVCSREECDRMDFPKLELPPMTEPWLGWKHSAWQTQWEAFGAGEGPLPTSHVPAGLELEGALREKGNKDNAAAVEALALWLCFRGRADEALALVKSSALSTSRRIAGLILWKKKQDPVAAVTHLEAGPLSDPIAIVELDQLYAELGRTEKRQALLAGGPDHRFIIERRAQLALAQGRPEETVQLLSQTSWPREHQRYVRTELWKQACAALGKPDLEVPETLNEDNLARFGAYWSDT